MSIGTKGLLDQREAAKSGVATGTHTGISAAPPEADLFGGVEGGAILASRPMGSRAGRPNRRTAAVAAYIQRKHGDPLHELARLGNADLRELARELLEIGKEMGIKADLSAMGLLAFKRACLVDVLPYVHAKRAAEDEAGETVQPSLTINLGGLSPDALKIAPGGLDAGGFLDLTAQLEAGQARYAMPSDAQKPDESSDDEASKGE